MTIRDHFVCTELEVLQTNIDISAGRFGLKRIQYCLLSGNYTIYITIFFLNSIRS